MFKEIKIILDWLFDEAILPFIPQHGKHRKKEDDK